MSDDKVQGEGDYEAARRFKKDEAQFVKRHTKDGKKIRGNAKNATDEPTAEEREGLSHAKRAEQDKRDSERMRKASKRDV